MTHDIDITFDFRRDSGKGDPDRYSATLRRYHKMLWSKSLPTGHMFSLDDATAGHYLYHKSCLGEFSLSSDAVIPTFKWSRQVQAMIPKEELEAFDSATYTIGGIMVFPGKPVDGKWTINQARGCTKAIGDRFDLTVEAIRRHYEGGGSPLSAVLARYDDFFRLFGDFRGYVEFFLLQDLVSPDFSSVRISAPFDDFAGSPIPTTVEAYNGYKSDAVAFVEARNRRILGLAE